METKIVLIVLIVVILVILARCVRVVQQSKAYVIERLGAFHTVWSVGLHFKVPFIDRVLRVVSLKEQQELHDEAVGGDEVVHIDGLARHQLHGILLAEGFVDCVHSAASFFAFFHARKFRMPRS